MTARGGARQSCGRHVAGALACVLSLGATGAALAQFKWIDRDGLPAYGDTPPRDARQVQSISTAAGGGGDSDDPLRGLPYALEHTARSYPLALYTTAGSPACDSARAFLQQRGVPFSERTIITSEDRAEMARRGFGDRVPVLQVGSQLLRGFDEQAWGGALDAAGYPPTSIMPRGWSGPPARPLVEPAAELHPEPGAAAATEPASSGNAPPAPPP
jgi:glutaredoxin